VRYALYFAPPEDHPLNVAAMHWLGRNAFSGNTLPAPDLSGLTREEWTRFTADPRRYGFHATIKAPFRLADGKTESELLETARAFAASQAAFSMPKVALAALGPFFALIEDEPVEPLARFAEKVVTTFEAFRAPLTDSEIARRRPDRLSERERELLHQYGYPYVLDQFQFHMSLTGAVPVDRAEPTHALLKRHFRDFIGKPLDISHLALFREEEAGADFRVLALFPLGR
jgi:putative phosphonate metabolism protein